MKKKFIKIFKKFLNILPYILITVVIVFSIIGSKAKKEFTFTLPLNPNYFVVREELSVPYQWDDPTKETYTLGQALGSDLENSFLEKMNDFNKSRDFCIVTASGEVEKNTGVRVIIQAGLNPGIHFSRFPITYIVVEKRVILSYSKETKEVTVR